MDRCNYDSSLLCFYLGLKAAHDMPTQSGWVAKYYKNLARNYYHLLKFDSSAHYLYQGLRFVETHAGIDKEIILQHYLLASQYWSHNHNFEKSLAYLNQAEALTKSAGNKDLWLDVLSRRSAFFITFGRLDSALLDARKIIEGKPESLKRQWSGQVLVANVLFNKKKYREALPYIREAIKLCVQSHNQTDLHFTKNGLAAVYSNLGDYDKALALFHELIDSTVLINGQINKVLINLYRNLASTNFKLGRHEKANESYKTAITLMDSFHKMENNRVLASLETQHQVAKKDKLLAAQQVKLANQKTWIISVSGAALLALGLSFGLLKRKKHKEQMAELKATLAGAEQERTRMAQELHDGVLSRLAAVKLNFATLPGMHTDTAEEPEGFKEALQQLEQSIFELRATSHNLYPEMLRREGLVEALRLFCEKIGNIASIDIGFEAIGHLPALPADWELSLYRIVQELVQNIVKHSGARSAMVQLVIKDGLLTISVEDEGKGLPADWKKKGMGLSRLEKQLKAMQGRVEISTDNGTNIYMEFDLSKINDEKPGN